MKTIIKTIKNSYMNLLILSFGEAGPTGQDNNDSKKEQKIDGKKTNELTIEQQVEAIQDEVKKLGFTDSEKTKISNLLNILKLKVNDPNIDENEKLDFESTLYQLNSHLSNYKNMYDRVIGEDLHPANGGLKPDMASVKFSKSMIKEIINDNQNYLTGTENDRGNYGHGISKERLHSIKQQLINPINFNAMAFDSSNDGNQYPSKLLGKINNALALIEESINSTKNEQMKGEFSKIKNNIEEKLKLIEDFDHERNDDNTGNHRIEEIRDEIINLKGDIYDLFKKYDDISINLDEINNNDSNSKGENYSEKELNEIKAAIEGIIRESNNQSLEPEQGKEFSNIANSLRENTKQIFSLSSELKAMDQDPSNLLLDEYRQKIAKLKEDNDFLLRDYEKSSM